MANDGSLTGFFGIRSTRALRKASVQKVEQCACRPSQAKVLANEKPVEEPHCHEIASRTFSARSRAKVLGASSPENDMKKRNYGAEGGRNEIA